MSTVTKQWLQQKIADMEAARDEIPFGLDEDDSNTLAAMKLALSSLEAEPAIHRWRRVTVEPYGPYPWHYGDFIGFSKPVEGIEDEYFYSAPPVPVSVPTFDEWLEIRGNKPLGWVKDAMRESYDACRAAMLQGADGNSPVTKDGWVMVPVEPTMEILDEFDSIIDHGAEDSKEAWSRLIAAAPQKEAE